MLVAVNSKRRTYDPLTYMQNGAEIRRRAAEARERALPTGDELLMQLTRSGAQIIDNRADKR